MPSVLLGRSTKVTFPTHTRVTHCRRPPFIHIAAAELTQISNSASDRRSNPTDSKAKIKLVAMAQTSALTLRGDAFHMPFQDVSVDDTFDSLSVTQLSRLACEALVLCMPVTLSQLSQKDENALRDVCMSMLAGPSASASASASDAGADTAPETIASTLRLEGYDDPYHLQELQPHLHFRLLLLGPKAPRRLCGRGPCVLRVGRAAARAHAGWPDTHPPILRQRLRCQFEPRRVDRRRHAVRGDARATGG